MMTVASSVTDRATPVVFALGQSVNPARLRPIVGRAVVNRLRSHLFDLDRSRPNALGGARTHFYADAARGTHFDVLPDGVMISINQVGIRQRILGGTITPKTAKFLTIPARAEAHGKRASEFNDLIVLRRGDHRYGEPYALARAVRTTLRVTGAATAAVLGARRLSQGAQEGGEIMFWLKKSVTQAPDPSVVPTQFELAAAAFSAINADRDRLVAQARARSGGKRA